MASTETLVDTGEKLFTVKMSLFCRGAGDFGGEGRVFPQDYVEVAAEKDVEFGGSDGGGGGGAGPAVQKGHFTEKLTVFQNAQGFGGE